MGESPYLPFFFFLGLCAFVSSASFGVTVCSLLVITAIYNYYTKVILQIFNEASRGLADRILPWPLSESIFAVSSACTLLF